MRSLQYLWSFCWSHTFILYTPTLVRMDPTMYRHKPTFLQFSFYIPGLQFIVISGTILIYNCAEVNMFWGGVCLQHEPLTRSTRAHWKNLFSIKNKTFPNAVYKLSQSEIYKSIEKTSVSQISHFSSLFCNFSLCQRRSCPHFLDIFS